MDPDTFLDRIARSTAGRILLTLIQTFLVSQALLLVFIFRQVVDLEVLKYTVVVCVGLAAGFTARRLLQGHTRILEVLTALLAAALSLAAQYSLTGGFIGILPLPGTSRYPAWDSLIQLGAAALGAILVIYAFRARPKPPAAAGQAVQVQRTAPHTAPGARWRIPGRQRASKKKAPRESSPTASERNPSLAISKVSLAEPPSAVKRPPRRRKKSSSPEIHFIGEEEHTCPYCLDAVEKGDPRGVKVCPICKTWHHADCWGITGACQIPHMHEK